MPTTLLHGESWDMAYARRFREEAEQIVRCPVCNSHNWEQMDGHTACGIETSYKMCECGHEWGQE